MAAYLIVSDDVQEGNNIGTTRKVLEDFDFSLDLLLLNWLQDLDDAFLIVNHVDTLKDLGIFSTA